MIEYRGGSRPSVGLTISIDTEEDNWTPSREHITTRNIGELPKLAGLFAGLGVRATYFTTYQVAVNPDAGAVIRDLHTGGLKSGHICIPGTLHRCVVWRPTSRC